MIREAEATMEPSLPSRRTALDQLRLLVDIARPKVMALVVFTAVPVLGMTDHALTVSKAFWVLVGTALAGTASSALNAYLERDRDARMARTRGRPIPAAQIVPWAVLAYGLLLTAVSTAILAWIGGPLAAGVGLGTIAFYVLVYTLWLKPRTPQNIVIGGAAGATAPLIASAALDGSISLAAWVLFAIIFLWTPPHFWAIALYRKQEYRQAGFPMMPLVVGDQPTRWRSLAYTLLLVPLTLSLTWLGYLGLVYAACAVGLGAWFTWRVVASMRLQTVSSDRRVFTSSTAYLSLLFLAMLVDLAV